MHIHIPATTDHFFIDLDEVLQRITRIDPRAYDRTRNYLDGAVTYLSPFVSHGVISTIDIAQGVLSSHTKKHSYRLLYELAWREFFHRSWHSHGNRIFADLLQPQQQVQEFQMPWAIAHAETGVKVLDNAIETLQETGIMHNHNRMWLAGVVCNIAHRAWLPAARWMHYHLLDGDLACNSLSWQWVAGTNSHKRYIANQDNLNKYSKTEQRGGFLDVSYEQLADSPTPEVLRKSFDPHFEDPPFFKQVSILQGDVALHSLWNLDPTWQVNTRQHILFIESDWLKRWPLSPLRWKFVQHLAAQCDCVILSGSLTDLISACERANVIRREHPDTRHWPGVEETRPWLYPEPEKPFNSFSQFWKQVKGSLDL